MGAGGEDIGRLVAGKLGFDYVDEDIVTRAAQRGDVSPEDVADAERRQSLLRRLFTELGTGTGVETYGLAPVPGGDLPDDMRALIREAIEEVAARGKVVIVAHAASFALAGRPSVGGSTRRSPWDNPSTHLGPRARSGPYPRRRPRRSGGRCARPTGSRSPPSSSG